MTEPGRTKQRIAQLLCDELMAAKTSSATHLVCLAKHVLTEQKEPWLTSWMLRMPAKLVTRWCGRLYSNCHIHSLDHIRHLGHVDMLMSHTGHATVS